MRDCKKCKHFVKSNEGHTEALFGDLYDCEKWECEFEPEEQEPTTKNDLGVDLISRADAIKAMQEKSKKLKNLDTINGLCGAVAILYDMPSVTPQEPQTFKWCTDCKEYNQEKHCCHRWSKVIRDTVEEMKQEQEPKTGHWIPTYGNVKCSVCGSVKDSREVGRATHYCDFCGAKMESEG